MMRITTGMHHIECTECGLWAVRPGAPLDTSPEIEVAGYESDGWLIDARGEACFSISPITSDH